MVTWEIKDDTENAFSIFDTFISKMGNSRFIYIRIWIGWEKKHPYYSTQKNIIFFHKKC